MSYKLSMTGEELSNKLDETANIEIIQNSIKQGLFFRGSNPITSTDEDTVNFWKQQLPGIYWFSNGALGLSKAPYGFLIHIQLPDYPSEFQQIYIVATHGQHRYSRGANAAGWRNDADVSGAEAWYLLTGTDVS